MTVAGDFTFRQAFPLNSRSQEAVFRSAQHLLGENRPADTLLVAETALKPAPEHMQLQSSAYREKSRNPDQGGQRGPHPGRGAFWRARPKTASPEPAFRLRYAGADRALREYKATRPVSIPRSPRLRHG
jgi:hypothetical protein